MSDSAVTPAEALKRLREGNQRFVNDTRSVEVYLTQLRRHEFASGQQPFAVILTCADSRVPVEMLFDQGIGDLFVIRVAGNVAAPSLIGSAEYAASVLGTQLAVVMGHSGCGAVQATLDVLSGSAQVPSDNIRDIVERIRPAAETVLSAAAGASTERILEETVRANVRTSADHLRHGSRVIERLCAEGKFQVLGAEYDLTSGKVDFFDGCH